MTSDPRFVRSAAALRGAVLDLARERSVESISVTEIAKAANVTRATFYNHATSPAALLTGILRGELDTIRDTFLAQVTERPDRVPEVWSASGQWLLDHIEHHRDVYRMGLTPSAAESGSVLATLLAEHIEATLATFLTVVHPGGADSPARVAMRAAFLSHGMVGAYRAWLTADEPLIREQAVAVIFESTPAWWFSLVDAPESH